MAASFLARVELHEYPARDGTVKKPTDATYTDLHKAMRKPGFSRMVKIGGKLLELPHATYDRPEVVGDTCDSIQAKVVAAAKSAWPVFGAVTLKYQDSDFRQEGLRLAPQSLIDFEKQNPPSP